MPDSSSIHRQPSSIPLDPNLSPTTSTKPKKPERLNPRTPFEKALDPTAHKSARDLPIKDRNVNQMPSGKTKASDLHLNSSDAINHTITKDKVSPQVFALLSKTPIILSDVDYFIKDLSTLKNMYEEDLKRLNETSIDKNSPEFIKLSNNIKALDAKIINMRNFQAAHPFYSENLKGAIELRHEVFSSALDEILKDLQASNPDLNIPTKREAILKKLGNLKFQQLASEDPKELMASIQNGNKAFLAIIKSEFSKSELAKVPITKINAYIEEKSIQALSDEKCWPVIKKTLYLLASDKESVLKYDTTVTPASKLEAQQGGSIFSIAGVPPGGRPSADKAAKNAVNLQHRTLQNEKGQSIYSCFRHGVHSAFKCKDSEERKVRNLQRARETVAAMVLKDEHAMKQIADGKGKEPSNPVKLPPIWSVNLQTPSLPARLLGKLGISIHPMLEEHKLINDQMQAWKTLTDEEGNSYVMLKEKDSNGIETERKVYVETEVVGLNFGVNALSFGIFGNKIGWYDAEKTNQDAFTNLFGLKAGQKLPKDLTGLKGLIGGSIENLKDGRIQDEKELESKNQQLITLTESNAPNSEKAERSKVLKQEIESLKLKIDVAEKKIKQVNALLPQIIDIYNSKNFRSGKDPYKMAARMIALGNILNQNVAFNCKSGKDRTSQADSEAAYLMSHWELHGSFPEPKTRLSKEDRIAYQQFVMNMGNFEIQKENTGVAGYKLFLVPDLYKRIGKAVTDVFHGAANATKY